MRTCRPLTGVVATGAALVLLVPSPAHADPATEFAVERPEPSCGIADPVTARLSVRIADRRQPDGTVHYWLNVTGTITNDATEDFVRIQATRRFFDDEPDDQSRFAGLQSRFSAPGHGVLHLNAGWAAGALSENIATYATRGRWDGIRDVLPSSVCRVLAGG